MLIPSITAFGCCFGSCDSSHDRSPHQSRSARIIVIEEAACNFTDGIKSFDGLFLGVDHLGLLIRPHPPIGHREPADHGVGLKGRGIDLLSPVRLVRV